MVENNSNKRIAKNSMFLFFRMLFVMFVSIFTSRVILSNLGEIGYGLYNVVGGVVTTFTFLSMAMGNASARFITISLGKDDINKTKVVFNNTLFVHIFVSILILLIAETVGLWFVNTQMTIPKDSLLSVNWVYQISIITTILGIIGIPFNATIIAHEKMNVFAFISVVDVIFKLLILYLLVVSPIDKLISYAFLLMMVQVLDISLYIYYCKKHFEEVKLTLEYDSGLIKEMINFSGWSLIGNLSFVCYTQGVNIVLNIFCGPVINAARAIAVQVESAVKNFIINFQTAASPQITISYSQGDFERLKTLLFSSSRLSFFILYSMIFPIVLEADTILRLWLEKPPEHSTAFVRLILMITVLDCLARPAIIVMNATGNIRKYQIVSSGILLLVVPIAYMCLRLGAKPEYVFVGHFIVAFIALYFQISILFKYLKIAIVEYYNEVIKYIFRVVFLSSIIPLSIYLIMENSMLKSILCILTSFMFVLASIYFVGLSKPEKQYVFSFVDSMKKKYKFK